MWCFGRQQSTPTAHDVVDADYVTIADFSAATLGDCRRADTRNQRIYAARTKLLAQCGGAVVPSAAALRPPAESNETRYLRWHREHTPVRADLQTAAVEKLMAADGRFDGDPSAAIALAAPVDPTALPCLFYQPYGGNTEGYTVFTLQELGAKSLSECQAADAANASRFARLSRASISARSRLSSARWAQVTASPDPPPLNTLRKSKLLEREALVSARKQTDAVRRLFIAKKRAGLDYEPQNAIEAAAALEEEEPTAPPLYLVPDEAEAVMA